MRTRLIILTALLITAVFSFPASAEIISNSDSTSGYTQITSFEKDRHRATPFQQIIFGRVHHNGTTTILVLRLEWSGDHKPFANRSGVLRLGDGYIQTYPLTVTKLQLDERLAAISFDIPLECLPDFHRASSAEIELFLDDGTTVLGKIHPETFAEWRTILQDK